MGLRTARSGAEEADDLNSADVGDDAFYDCNANGIDDAVDCANGTSHDNNFNGIPDECEDIVEFCSGQTFSSPLLCHCPCGNCDSTSTGIVGCANGAQHPVLVGAGLTASGATSVSAPPATFKLIGGSLVPGQPGLYFQGDNALNNGAGNAFGDGLRCAGGSVVRLQVRAADTLGVSETNADLIAKGGVASGDVKYYQLWYRDPATSLCGNLFNLTNGVKVTFGP